MLWVINICCCIAIGVFGLVVYINLKNCHKQFEEILDEFDSIKHVDNTYQEKVSSDGNVTMNTSSVIEYDRNLLEENRIRFNDQYSVYVKYSQLIALFPLLGILGTVLGLVLNSDQSNVEKLVSGLNVALMTTLVGLVCSILLRGYDSVKTGKIVNDIDAQFNTVDGAINRQTLEKIYSQANNVK